MSFSGSGSGNWPSFFSIWVANLTTYTETINHSFFLQEDWGLWLLPSRELPLLKSPPGLAVHLQPASLFCCIKCTRWGCGLLLLAYLHQSAQPTWSLYVCPFFTPLLPQSGFQDHVLQDSGESYLNKQGKKFSCIGKIQICRFWKLWKPYGDQWPRKLHRASPSIAKHRLSFESGQRKMTAELGTVTRQMPSCHGEQWASGGWGLALQSAEAKLTRWDCAKSSF